LIFGIGVVALEQRELIIDPVLLQIVPGVRPFATARSCSVAFAIGEELPKSRHDDRIGTSLPLSRSWGRISTSTLSPVEEGFGVRAVKVNVAGARAVKTVRKTSRPG